MNNWYDEIAHTYDLDPFGLIGETRGVAFEQIQAVVKDPKHVIDLGCGTGDGLCTLRELYSSAELVGLDLSEKMLDVATEKVDFLKIHDSVAHVDKHAESHSFDLVLAHYVMGYVSAEDLFPVFDRLLKRGGLCSVITTTFESFQTLYGFCDFLDLELAQKITQNPLHQAALLSAVSLHGFEVVQHTRFERELVFEGPEDILTFARDGGWLIQFVSQFQKEVNALLASGPFPVREAFSSEILLIQKR